MNNPARRAAYAPLSELGANDLDTLSRGHCPACSYRGFVLGPAGGAALNIECGNLDCRTRYNVVNFAGQILMAQTIPSEAEGGGSWPVGDTTRHGGSFS